MKMKHIASEALILSYKPKFQERCLSLVKAFINQENMHINIPFPKERKFSGYDVWVGRPIEEATVHLPNILKIFWWRSLCRQVMNTPPSRPCMNTTSTLGVSMRRSKGWRRCKWDNNFTSLLSSASKLCNAHPAGAESFMLLLFAHLASSPMNPAKFIPT